MRFPLKHTVVHIEIVYTFLTHKYMSVLQFKVDVNCRHRKKWAPVIFRSCFRIFKNDIHCIVIPIAVSEITIKNMLLELNGDRKNCFGKGFVPAGNTPNFASFAKDLEVVSFTILSILDGIPVYILTSPECMSYLIHFEHAMLITRFYDIFVNMLLYE